jgi:hypothetical protein
MSVRKVPASAVAVAAFFGLVALPRAAIPVIDGDAFWHIRAGQEVLATGSVATHDTWSIVGDGMRWVSQDWLANVMMALPYELGDIGLALLSVVFALLVVLALAVLWRAIGARDPRIGWLGRLIWLTVGLTVAGPAIGVRVQVIDLTLAVVVIGLLWVYLADPRPRWLIGLPLVAMLWTNLHAGWLLLFLLGGAVLTGELVDRSLGRRLDPPPLPWRSSIALGIALVVSLGAIAVNPNGLAMYLYPFETAAIEAHRDFLAEWSPPDITTLPGQLFAGFVVIGVVPAFLLGWRRMRVADALVLAGLTVMAFTAARFLLVVGPIGAAVVALTLAPVISQTRLGRATAPMLDRLSRPRPGLGAVNVGLAVALMLLGLVATWGRISPAEQGHLIGKHMPVDAVDWIVANDPGSRPFNTYSWGGYLGLMRPDTPIFIDGRSDIYGDAPIREYAHTIMLTIDPARTLDRYQIDHVLFNTDHHFARWLDASPEWEQVYSDPLASVWVRAVE